jgi:hypothetical protein
MLWCGTRRAIYTIKASEQQERRKSTSAATAAYLNKTVNRNGGWRVFCLPTAMTADRAALSLGGECLDYIGFQRRTFSSSCLHPRSDQCGCLRKCSLQYVVQWLSPPMLWGRMAIPNRWTNNQRRKNQRRCQNLNNFSANVLANGRGQ